MLHNNRRKIKNYWINPKVQLRFIVGTCLSSVALVLLSGYIVWGYVSENYTLLVELSPMKNEVKELLRAELENLWWALILSGVGFVAMVTFGGLFLSHRTVGPLVAFQRIFERINKNNLSPRLKLRPGDDFLEIAQGFNDMMDRLESASAKKPRPKAKAQTNSKKSPSRRKKAA